MTRNPQVFPEGLYIHLPFCAAICTYCDFASEIYAAARATRYLNALEKEFAARISELGLGTERYAPRTIFLGGGTPSALNIAELTCFFDLLEKYVETREAAEFTIEANPGSTEPAKLDFLRARGVNRISFGVQSFQPHLLKLLGRVHGAEQGAQAVALAREAGFDNVSIDLMHGLPTQSLADLKSDLEQALALKTEHISAYGLIYESGTPLKNAVEKKQIERLSPEEEGLHYRTVMETLERGGLPQYEISNYARAGLEAQHNLIYWRNEAYMGMGVSAASFSNWTRSTNHYEMDAYINAAAKTGHAIAESEQLDAEARARESLVLELRLRRGVDAAEFKSRWGLDITTLPALEKFMKQNLIEYAGGRYRIKQEAQTVADGILSDFV